MINKDPNVDNTIPGPEGARDSCDNFLIFNEFSDENDFDSNSVQYIVFEDDVYISSSDDDFGLWEDFGSH